jgi:chromosome segregation ATPase
MRWWPFVWKSEYDRLGESLSRAWSLLGEKEKSCKACEGYGEILIVQNVKLSKEKVALEDQIAMLRDELRKISSLTSDWQHAVALEVKAGDEARKEATTLQRLVDEANTKFDKYDAVLADRNAIVENLESALSAANEEIAEISENKEDLQAKYNYTWYTNQKLMEGGQEKIGKIKCLEKKLDDVVKKVLYIAESTYGSFSAKVADLISGQDESVDNDDGRFELGTQ